MRHDGKCIFCDSPDLSGEHIWPKWAGPVLGSQGYRGKREEFFVVKTKKTKIVSQEIKTRNGSTTSKKIFAVCQSCNNNWMSQIENRAKNVVLPLMRGDPIDLNAGMQRTLVEWIVLKILVADNNRTGEAVFRQPHLVAFKENRRIPSGMNIWVGRCIDERCKNVFLKQALLLALPGQKPPSDGRKNTQSTAIGIGELFIYALSCITDGIDMNRYVRFDQHLVRIWPIGESLVWPPMRILNCEQAMHIGLTMDALMARPNISWAALPK